MDEKMSNIYALTSPTSVMRWNIRTDVVAEGALVGHFITNEANAGGMIPELKKM